MKLLTRQKWATNKSRDQRKYRANGGITLETALVMPSFLLFVFFLIFLVKTSLIMMALHGALSQAARLTASVWHPIYMAQSDDSRKDESSAPSIELGGVKDTIGALGPWLPAPLNDWAASIAEGRWSPEEEAAKLALEQLVLHLADEETLNADRLRIAAVKLPKPHSAEEGYLSIEAEYRLPLQLPWHRQPLALRVSARERAWIGGSPSRATLADPSAAPTDIAFVSLEPNPVRPGRKATLTLRTNPGATLDLTVIYKSGKSKAKHLGVAVADETGHVSWTWHVSGNTTSGEWTWVARAEDGGSYTQQFRVARETE